MKIEKGKCLSLDEQLELQLSLIDGLDQQFKQESDVNMKLKISGAISHCQGAACQIRRTIRDLKGG
jgi:hypothetical protein